jgi:four helix bundle protein
MNSYRDLDIFNESKRLAIEVHHLTLRLPKFELYEEGSQARKSSKSVTSMIVEGFSRRRYKADFVKFLIIGQAECDETKIHLQFLNETGSCTDAEKILILIEGYTSLSKRLNKFIQWVEDEFVYKR